MGRPIKAKHLENFTDNPLLLYSPCADLYALGFGGQLLEKPESAIEVSFVLGDGGKIDLTIRRGRNGNIHVNIENVPVARTLASLENPFTIYSPGLAGIAKSEEFISNGVLLRTIARGDANLVFLLDRVTKRRHSAGDETAARSLAHQLGHLPLALEQAASLIIEMRWSFDKYQEQFRDARPQFLERHHEDGIRYTTSVAKTWSITLNQLAPLARALLRIAAWFAADTIPRGVFTADKPLLSETLGGNADVSDLSIDKALGELDRFSLIRLTSETVSVHRLLQAVEQDSLPKEERERWLVWAVRLFAAFAPASPDDVRTWGVWLPLSQHAETLIEHETPWRRCATHRRSGQ